MRFVIKNDQDMQFYTNRGYHNYKEEGELSLFLFTVFYDGDYMANILSLNDVFKSFCVTMNKNKDCAMLIHMNPHTILSFSSFDDRLYYYDTSIRSNDNNGEQKNYYFFSAIAKNKE